jgi:hypothetical protein
MLQLSFPPLFGPVNFCIQSRRYLSTSKYVFWYFHQIVQMSVPSLFSDAIFKHAGKENIHVIKYILTLAQC